MSFSENFRHESSGNSADDLGRNENLFAQPVFKPFDQIAKRFRLNRLEINALASKFTYFFFRDQDLNRPSITEEIKRLEDKQYAYNLMNKIAMDANSAHKIKDKELKIIQAILYQLKNDYLWVDYINVEGKPFNSEGTLRPKTGITYTLRYEPWKRKKLKEIENSKLVGLGAFESELLYDRSVVKRGSRVYDE